MIDQWGIPLFESTQSILSKWENIIKKPNVVDWWLNHADNVVDDFRGYGAEDYPDIWEPFVDDFDENDEPIIDKKRIKKFITVQFNKKVKPYISKHLKSKGNQIILYRCIKADNFSDIRFDHVGRSWALTEDSADCSLILTNTGNIDFILTGLVPDSSIDINFSLMLNLLPFTDENEIRLLDDKPLTIIGVHERGTSGNLLKKPRKVKA